MIIGEENLRAISGNGVLARLKAQYTHTWMAAFYHRIVPHITVWRSYYGFRVYMDLNANADDFFRANLQDREKLVLRIPKLVQGLTWDVGANVGLFSVRVHEYKDVPWEDFQEMDDNTKQTWGSNVVAFEQSLGAVRLLRKTKSKNDLDFLTIVERALTVDPVQYIPSTTSYTENAVLESDEGEATSITYLEAERLYGVPSLIKMDIEGGELGFLASPDFKAWIVANGMVWIVAIHKDAPLVKWTDVPHFNIDAIHHVYSSDEQTLHTIQHALWRSE